MFIRTDNLLLRPGWVEDAPALAAAFGREDVVMTLAKAPWPYRVEDAVAWLGRDRSAVETDLLIFLRTPVAPRLIGGIGIAATKEDAPELGYWIVPSMWGRGYATEAGHAVIAAARDSLRLERLTAGHFVENPTSGAVLRKLGFEATGTLRPRACAARGVALPCVDYALALNPAMAEAA
jgi:RimJ/RimL family protein N-acetyltransferase